MDRTYEIFSGNILCARVTEGVCRILDKAHAPLFLVNGGAFTDWVEHRALSESRGLTSRNLKSASGLATNASLFDTVMKVHAASVTDDYWVRELNEAISFQEIGFDRYDGFFYRLSLGLDSNYQDYVSDRSNPELTNIGNSEKAWYVDEHGMRWLYKRQPLHECFHEIAASRIALALGIASVKYELVYASEPDPEYGRYGIVRSADFTWQKNVNLEHMDSLLQGTGISERDIAGNADLLTPYGLAKDYLNIKYLDILTGNPDRHMYNYGVLRDRTSGSVVALAPNFDNNFAFTVELDPAPFIAVAKDCGWVSPRSAHDDFSDVEAELTGMHEFENYHISALIQKVQSRRAHVHHVM